VLVTDSKTSVLENGQGDSQFGCEKCRSSEFKLCFKEVGYCRYNHGKLLIA
jgi:hypothetical protein